MSYDNLKKKFSTIYTPVLEETQQKLLQKGNRKRKSTYTLASLLTSGWLIFLGFTGVLSYIKSTSVMLVTFGVIGLIWMLSILNVHKYHKQILTIYNLNFQSKFIDLFISQYRFNLDWQKKNKFSYREFVQLGLLEVFGEVINSFECSLSFKHRSYDYQQAFIEFKDQEDGTEIKGCLYVFDYPQPIKAKTILSAQSSILKINSSPRLKYTDPNDLDESLENYPFLELWSDNVSHSYSVCNEDFMQILAFLSPEEFESSTFVWTDNKLILFIQSTISNPFSIDIGDQFIHPSKYKYSKTSISLAEKIINILDKSSTK
ncbi:MAG: hypothetical protein MK212_12560 [Saprospiraceae bacterium]|nr:hypothetical protein [Saprospiraceae bacterium]